MTIKVRRERTFGVDRIYPVCDKAKELLDLIGGKTFTPADIEKLKGQGYVLVIDGETL